jgi:glutathione S-transferase
MVLPRPILADLGITHRRVPILAIGKDVYCDSSSIIDALQHLSDGLRRSPSDKAYEAFSLTILSSLMRAFPIEAMRPELTKDRATIFRKSKA